MNLFDFMLEHPLVIIFIVHVIIIATFAISILLN